MDPFFAMARFLDSKMAPPVSNNWGFINDPEYWRKADLQVDELGLGKFITMPDAPGSPEWKFRPFPPKK